MNSARGTGQKKKKKKAETQDASGQSKRMLNIHLDTEFGAFRSAFSLFFFEKIVWLL